jgi:hypothetical protein
MVGGQICANEHGKHARRVHGKQGTVVAKTSPGERCSTTDRRSRSCCDNTVRDGIDQFVADFLGPVPQWFAFVVEYCKKARATHHGDRFAT